jgi:hypothetical protein
MIEIVPEGAVKLAEGIRAQAIAMVERHWQPSIEELDDDGAAHREELRWLVTHLKIASSDVTPLLDAWRANWERYRAAGGALEFESIEPAI